jgi:hypothetical protein
MTKIEQGGRFFTASFLRARKHLFGTLRHKALIEATLLITGERHFMERSRHPKKAFARQAMMIAARMTGKYSLEECAAMVGLQDSTTAGWAIRKADRNKILKETANRIHILSERMIKTRRDQFSKSVDAMIDEMKLDKEEATDKICEADNPSKVLRPNVEKLRRKAWEHDTPESKRIARLREQRMKYYG